MIDTCVGRTAITFKTLELWSAREATVAMCDYADVPGRFYLRFTVDDHPGVLAKIAGTLGEHQISIASVLQHESPEDGQPHTVPLIIMTHTAKEGSVQRAMAAISKFNDVKPGSVRMRVLD
jgi:homoserine dehydrogenase